MCPLARTHVLLIKNIYKYILNLFSKTIIFITTKFVIDDFFSKSQLFTFTITSGSLSSTRLYMRSVIRYLFNIHSFGAPDIATANERIDTVGNGYCHRERKYRYSGHCPLSCDATARLSRSASAPASHPSDPSSKNSADRHIKSSYTKSRFECISSGI